MILDNDVFFQLLYRVITFISKKNMWQKTEEKIVPDSKKFTE